MSEELEAAIARVVRLESELRDARDDLRLLRERKEGVVAGKTIIVETGRTKPRRGVFLRLSSLGWAHVSPLKKDGTPSKNTATFYSWEVVQ